MEENKELEDALISFIEAAFPPNSGRLVSHLKEWIEAFDQNAYIPLFKRFSEENDRINDQLKAYDRINDQLKAYDRINDQLKAYEGEKAKFAKQIKGADHE